MGDGRKTRQVRALFEGRAFVDLSGWWKVHAVGREARAWLDDLITARVADLEEGAARRSLLLTPTGRIRADFTVAGLPEGFLLVQEPRQPEPLVRLLAPYLLSADVELRDRTHDLGLLAFPSRSAPPPGRVSSPSCLGSGFDLRLEPGETADAATREAMEADAEAVEEWRVLAGAARFPVDLGPDSLPQEAGLDHAIEYAKGCFLGQEAAAKVRNLGHPPFVVLAMRADRTAHPGEPVRDEDREVGVVTSVAEADGRPAVIARVRWGAREAELRTAGGAVLSDPRVASGTA